MEPIVPKREPPIVVGAAGYWQKRRTLSTLVQVEACGHTGAATPQGGLERSNIVIQARFLVEYVRSLTLVAGAQSRSCPSSGSRRAS